MRYAGFLEKNGLIFDCESGYHEKDVYDFIKFKNYPIDEWKNQDLLDYLVMSKNIALVSMEHGQWRILAYELSKRQFEWLQYMGIKENIKELKWDL